jgi:3-oxoadipate enol-lactonase/4-carboxymuconolactone decarboxylase
MAAMSTMNLLEGIATIGVPTTVLVGSRDRLTAPARSEQMVRAIPGSRLVMVPGRGHMLPLEDPDAVTEAIETSFDREDPIGSPPGAAGLSNGSGHRFRV